MLEQSKPLILADLIVKQFFISPTDHFWSLLFLPSLILATRPDKVINMSNELKPLLNSFHFLPYALIQSLHMYLFQTGQYVALYDCVTNSQSTLDPDCSIEN